MKKFLTKLLQILKTLLSFEFGTNNKQMKVDTDKLLSIDAWRAEEIKKGNHPTSSEYIRRQIKKFEDGHLTKQELGFTPIRISGYIFVLPN